MNIFFMSMLSMTSSATARHEYLTLRDKGAKKILGNPHLLNGRCSNISLMANKLLGEVARTACAYASGQERGITQHILTTTEPCLASHESDHNSYFHEMVRHDVRVHLDLSRQIHCKHNIYVQKDHFHLSYKQEEEDIFPQI